MERIALIPRSLPKRSFALIPIVHKRRTDNVTILDAPIEKGSACPAAVVSRRSWRLHIFNAHPEQNTNWTSGPSFLQPFNVVAPRMARRCEA